MNAKGPALAGTKKVAALYCTEVATCAAVVPFTKPALAAEGDSLVYSASYSASEPNYTALCLAAKAAGANEFTLAGVSPTAIQRILDNCAAQHYYPVMGVGGPTIGSLALFKDKSIPKILISTATVPWFVKNTSTAVFQKVMGSYLPGAASDSGVINDWAGLQLFAAAAQHIAKNATATNQDIYTGLYTIPAGDTLGGITVPLHFTKGQPGPTSCYFISESVKSHLETPFGVKPFCEPASTITAQEKAVGL
jgi:branched-chain amino acid transport system substrate-binding protein